MNNLFKIIQKFERKLLFGFIKTFLTYNKCNLDDSNLVYDHIIEEKKNIIQEWENFVKNFKNKSINSILMPEVKFDNKKLKEIKNKILYLNTYLCNNQTQNVQNISTNDRKTTISDMNLNNFSNCKNCNSQPNESSDKRKSKNTSANYIGATLVSSTKNYESYNSNHTINSSSKKLINVNVNVKYTENK